MRRHNPFLMLAGLLATSALCAADGSSSNRTPDERAAAEQESLAHWPWYVEIAPKEGASATWVDFVLPPAVFDKARYDLQDLRVYRADGRESPYALRLRVEKDVREPFPTRQFNLTEGPDGSRELTLDLQRSDIEHNEVEIRVPGANCRRLVELEGSDDGNSWRPIQKQSLIDFERGDRKLRDESISYPPSRFRYLRARVHPDPLVDKNPLKIESVQVFRRVEVPGERVTQSAELAPRVPVRTKGGPGSAWILSLGGDQTPVDRLEIDIADADFARDFAVEAAGPLDSKQPFVPITNGVLRRRAGEKVAPLEVSFAETRAARLRLLVTDHRNPELKIRAVRFSAPARQVVCPATSSPLRLYFGNPKAGATAYDFARNLPERLAPPPVRWQVGLRQSNPGFVPEPLPFTERWSSLIYAVLATVVLVLAVVLVCLSRSAIRIHDRSLTAQSTPEPASASSDSPDD